MSGGGIQAVRNLAAGTVALIAAFSSYMHMVHVALACAERREVAYVLPVSVDGMLVVATVVMVDDERHTRRVRPTARLAFSVGVAASLAANVAAAHPTIGARIVAAWPAVALLLVVEMLARPPAATAGVPPTPGAGRERRRRRLPRTRRSCFLRPTGGDRRHLPPPDGQAAARSVAAVPAAPPHQPGDAAAGAAQAIVPSAHVAPLGGSAPWPGTTATTANDRPLAAIPTAAPGTPSNLQPPVQRIAPHDRHPLAAGARPPPHANSPGGSSTLNPTSPAPKSPPVSACPPGGYGKCSTTIRRFRPSIGLRYLAPVGPAEILVLSSLRRATGQRRKVAARPGTKPAGRVSTTDDSPRRLTKITRVVAVTPPTARWPDDADSSLHSCCC